MEITLATVRHIMRQTFGRQSFIASFITQVTEDDACSTACITRGGHLRYNAAFVEEFVESPEDLFCLLVHELMHPMFGHFVYSDGELENIGADMVINAAISTLFPGPSGGGSLFTKFYNSQGVEGLLRPESRMEQSRYNLLYNAFYSPMNQQKKLSTGEVIHSLKVLTPMKECKGVVLLGGHGTGSDDEDGQTAPFNQQTASKISEELKGTATSGSNAGYSQALFDLLIDVLDSKLSVEKTLMRRFTTRRKVDRFLEVERRQHVTVSPIPISPSKRDLVLLSSGMTPVHYHNRATALAEKPTGLAVYLDVSGSVNEHLPAIVGLLRSFEKELTTVYLFSNAVREVPFSNLLKGRLKTTYGTDFNCIAQSILDRDLDKAVVFTDGFASLREDLSAQLQEARVHVMTVLFGWKKDCLELAPFGPVVRLDEVTR